MDDPGLAAPGPEYILRGHTAQVNSLAFAQNRSLLVSGDEAGHVAVWSLDTFRPLVFARAHPASILTALCWDNDTRLLTHGRDNKLKVFSLETAEAAKTVSVPSPAKLTPLESLYELETNAIGYCKCALLDLHHHNALVAVPSTLDDNLVDIFHLPSTKRTYRSIGKDAFDSKTGMVMAISLLTSNDSLQVVAGYEDGRVALFHRSLEKGMEPVLGEAQGWTKTFEARDHKEPMMGLSLDASTSRVWSVAADHLVVRYSLEAETEQRSRPYKTPYPGRGGVSVRNDGKILACAGWDGNIRVHSAQSFKPLAVLTHHRDSLYAIAFQPVVGRASSVQEGDRQTVLPFQTQSWLAAGGKEATITLWRIYPVT